MCAQRFSVRSAPVYLFEAYATLLYFTAHLITPFASSPPAPIGSAPK